MTYQPNFNNRKVINLFTKAIEFVERYVSTTTPNWLSTRHIDKHFGQGQLPSSQYLRSKLLVCIDGHFNFETGKCKTYIQNVDGVQELKQRLGMTQSQPTLSPVLQQQLNTGEFEYTEKSDRMFNPIQYIPRRVKRPLLAKNGYNYNYDIVCAAPTLLYQYAQKSGLKGNLKHIEYYIQNRSQVRLDLSNKYSIPVDQIKQIITGLFQGAYLSFDYRTRIYKILNGNTHQINALKSDTFLSDLREDIKSMWKIITPIIKKELNKNRINGKDKAAKYRELESEVMSVIAKQLKRSKNKFLLEHDGWTSKEVCDLNMLRSYVSSDTGYNLDIDWEIYTN